MLILMIAAVSCNSPKKRTLRESQLIGQWTNLSLLVTMQRLEKQDSILEAKEGEWEKVLKMKPILSEFYEDGTFTAKYSNLQEEIIKIDSGQWHVRNDSLVIITDGRETAYHFTIINDRIVYKSKLDWDGDGKSNDVYDAVQIRVKK